MIVKLLTSGDRFGDDPRDPTRLQRPSRGERVDGRRDAAGGRGQGQLDERKNRISGIHHEQDQTRRRISKCRYTFCF